MSSECRTEVERDEVRSSQDYRLNFKLAEACKADTKALCAHKCKDSQACGGQVLRCLTEQSDNITAQACKDEIFYFMKMEVKDFRNDVILAEACRNDVDKRCKSAKAGQCGHLCFPALWTTRVDRDAYWRGRGRGQGGGGLSVVMVFSLSTCLCTS